ncbi:HAMP domain-containing sensor histidine kinase [Acetatifactor aquisgranensis]|uniref:HAMP domain-containing sensor histidine kinase n=1 Tax=Acetatifactor aquisgranensis TaxID=2941233 RepID=UPI00203BD0D5|nr:HAMP domain-containing sensor histidine kinase [Acetatifactor aquisgranensis]
MKKRTFIIAQIFILAIWLTLLLSFALQETDSFQDAVAVNEALQSVRADWDRLESHENRTDLSYVVLDTEGNVLYRTGAGLSESVNRAIVHRDTILDIEKEGGVAGRLIVFNDSSGILESRKRTVTLAMAGSALVQWALCVWYLFYLRRVIIRPFRKLKDFARRVAGGNLDVPLAMDRENLFGAFTESFDIMRDELKKARMAEAKANAEKKELVAKLSHDIRTPVASIKAAAEVGAALASERKTRENYGQIIRKADQIDALVSNLFTATLEELEQLTVAPVDMESSELAAMLESADYFSYAAVPTIPECLLHADRLRLQQVFDNIFANSYKYGVGAPQGTGTFPENRKIDVTLRRENGYLAVCIEDCGGGVKEEELPFLKEKFRRGSNTGNLEGAGLGLYISDYFMKEMGGELLVENGENGLRVTVAICLSK